MQKESSNELLQKKKWRAITYDWDILSSYGDTSRAYCLTDLQAAWLLSNCDYFGWSSRWENCPCTEGDMQKMKAEMEYNLMNCIDIQPYQIGYLYQQQQNSELQALADLWDGVYPSSVNPNTPDDYYSGDGSDDRESALCTACKIYVYSYAQNWINQAQIALGIVAVVGLATSISIVGGIIASVLVGGLFYITSVAYIAMQDTDALDEVVCCMFTALDGVAITNANWLTCLDSCGFVAGTNEAIIRDIIASDLDNFSNWLSFINQVGNSYIYSQAGISDCPCVDVTWVWQSNFGLEKNIWQANSGAVCYYADWSLGNGFTSRDTGQISLCGQPYRRIIGLLTSDFTPTEIIDITLDYTITKGSYTAGAWSMQLVAVKNDDTTVSTDVLATSETDGTHQRTLTVNQTDIKRFVFQVSSSWANSESYGGSIVLNGITVRGKGSNPFS